MHSIRQDYVRLIDGCTSLEMLCTRNCNKSRSAAIMGLCASTLYALESMATAHKYLLDKQDMMLLAFAGSSDPGEDEKIAEFRHSSMFK